jgi:hypothetical protein
VNNVTLADAAGAATTARCFVGGLNCGFVGHDLSFGSFSSTVAIMPHAWLVPQKQDDHWTLLFFLVFGILVPTGIPRSVFRGFCMFWGQKRHAHHRFPQCGHLAETSIRLLPQKSHSSSNPCGRENQPHESREQNQEDPHRSIHSTAFRIARHPK